MKHYRHTWAEINLDAVDANVRQIKKRLAKETHVMAVVKANGYGHGALPIARQALKAGATALAVALLEEGLALREAGINAPILVLSWVPPESVPVAAAHDITLTVFQRDWLEHIPIEDLQHPLSLHLKWDTGMGRVGIRTSDELKEIIGSLKVLNNTKTVDIRLTGIYTHFATADEADLTFYHMQSEKFLRFLKFFKTLWPDPVVVHSSNSAAAIQFPEKTDYYIRFGIALYGLYPSAVIKEKNIIELQPAFSLHSRLIHVKEIHAGDTISYGREYVAKKREWIGTIPIGYGDGWSRRLQNASVLINGKRCPVVGRICMDQTMIRLDQSYKIGTKVTLIGEQQNNHISMDEIARHLNTINYEIPCMINERVPRIYMSQKE